MYEVKPIFDKTKIQVEAPTCMYKVKTVYNINAKQLESFNAQQLTNGHDGAVSQLTTKLQPDILQQIGNVLKVLNLNVK